jgi:hypothetical protein
MHIDYLSFPALFSPCSRFFRPFFRRFLAFFPSIFTSRLKIAVHVSSKCILSVFPSVAFRALLALFPPFFRRFLSLFPSIFTSLLN